MRSIMKDYFNTKPGKINIDITKSPDDILKVFTRYIIKTREEPYTLGEIKNGLKYFNLKDFELIKDTDSLPDSIKRRINGSSKKGSYDVGVVKAKQTIQSGKTNDVYCLVDRNSNFEGNQLGSLYSFRVDDVRFIEFNVDKLGAFSNMMRLLSDEDWSTIIKTYKELIGDQWDRLVDTYGSDDEVLYAYLGSFFKARVNNSGAKYYNRELVRLLQVPLLTRLIQIYNQELNYISFMEYNNQISKDYAKAFQTKKNIPKSHLEVMSSTKLLKEFKFIELDESVDLDKYRQVETEVLRILPLLPKSTVPKELRFRKLGNYRAAGLYFPAFKSIVVDLRDIWSFVHEYGHYIDYTYSDQALSLQDEFLPIIERYRINLAVLVDRGADISKDYVKYLSVSTEIFARGFELYYGKALNTFLVIPQSQLNEPAYQAYLMDEDLMALVQQYFSNQFK